MNTPLEPLPDEVRLEEDFSDKTGVEKKGLNGYLAVGTLRCRGYKNELSI